MENISKKDITFRMEKLKNRVSEINNKIIKNNEEMDSRYNFAKELGIKLDNICNTNEEIIKGLNEYISKTDEIISKIDNAQEDEIEQEYKILNNILYLDDIKLKNISQLIQENKDLTTREYINKIADKANNLIRNEEVKSIDFNILKLSKKSSFIEKITGKDKIRKALLENYTLKRVETINKKYIPENKSVLEIVNITRNCGYKSKALDEFITKLSNEYKFENLVENALIALDKDLKIPFFYNKEFLNRINSQNIAMLDRINENKKVKAKVSEYEMYNDMLKKDVSTLELLNFNSIIEEVV